MSHLRLWLVAARPRTLPAAVAPVLVGTALAASEDVFKPLRFAAALVGSIFIQIGTNLANDYSDARRGADTEDRLGPVRVTAGGLMPPRRVLVGTWVAFGIAVAAGGYLAAVAGWELLVVGVLSIAAGVLYTGGPRPYGYEGLGELFVFVFFGLVAVGGSYFVQTEDLRWEAVALGVPVGLLAAAILVVNNVRDIETDRRAGKRTLAVRLGRERAVRGVHRRCSTLAFAAVPVIAIARRHSTTGSCSRCLATPLAVPLARTLVHAPRRARAQPAAGRHRPAARRLLAPALRRPAAVVKRDLFVLSLPFREPFVTATGVISERRIILMRLEDDDGAVGYGEAAPFEPYDGVSVERVEAVLRGRSREELRQAEAAVEMALLDLDARREDRPVGEPGRDRDPGEHDAARRVPPRRSPRARRSACGTATSASS